MGYDNYLTLLQNACIRHDSTPTSKPSPATRAAYQHEQSPNQHENPYPQDYSSSGTTYGGIDMPAEEFYLGKNIGQQYCWCSLMWLMPLTSLSNCDYELNFYLRLILGPIHSNQVMGTDPVGSYHGTRNSRSNSVNPTYWYQSHD